MHYSYATNAYLGEQKLLARQDIALNLGVNYAISKKLSLSLDANIGKGISSMLRGNYRF